MYYGVCIYVFHHDSLCCLVCCVMLCCVVLYCIVLYCIVLYCIVLYCIVLYCVVLCCVVLHYLMTSYPSKSPLNNTKTPIIYFYFIIENLYHFINSLTFLCINFFSFYFYFSFFFLYFSWRKIRTSRLFWYDVNISWCVV